MSPRVPLRGACRAAGMSKDFRWLSATCEAQTTNVKRGLRSRCEETRDPARLSQHVPPDTGHTFCKRHHVAVQCVSSHCHMAWTPTGRYPHLMSSHHFIASQASCCSWNAVALGTSCRRGLKEFSGGNHNSILLSVFFAALEALRRSRQVERTRTKKLRR